MPETLNNPGAAANVEPAFRPAASLAFWCCLFSAAGLFAALALAPKLHTYRELRREYIGMQQKLVGKERQVDYLQKVADALEHDPEYAAELARVDFGSDGLEERIPVEPSLGLRGTGAPQWNAVSPTGSERHTSADILESPLLDSLSVDRRVRASLLGATCLLVLVAFTFLCDTARPSETVERIAWSVRCRRWLARRYSKPVR
jgi:hypothetical protein